jgi:hypothetical protein
MASMNSWPDAGRHRPPHWFSPVRQSAPGITAVILQYLGDVRPNQDQQEELFARCKIARVGRESRS